MHEERQERQFFEVLLTRAAETGKIDDALTREKRKKLVALAAGILEEAEKRDLKTTDILITLAALSGNLIRATQHDRETGIAVATAFCDFVFKIVTETRTESANP